VSGSFVNPEMRSRVRALAEPIGRGLARTGLTPNALTLIGFAIACVAAIAAAAQAWFLAGLLVIFGGVFDMFDGMVARATGKVSKAGAFMDSTFDRWGEAVVYVGIVWGALEIGTFNTVVLAAAAMASAFMVSYTRARAESLGFVPGKGMANVGLAPREVRLVILTVGLIVAGLLTPGADTSSCTTCAGGMAYPLNALALDVTLGLLALLATITTIQRIVVTLNQASREG
jgi:CDP-diacylglycerol---glycerol-3-phosphate 3-phosphatidyltransferase